MDIENFRDFLKKGGRSKSAIDRCVRYITEFEDYLEDKQGGKALQNATFQDLEGFIEWIEREPKVSAKGQLWGLIYYFEFISNEDLRRLAVAFRQQRIKRTPFPLRDFRGVDPEHIEKLSAVNVKNVKQMLKQASTPQARQELAQLSGVPSEAILELVKLSDLARIPGVKGIRARLYVDAGVDTLEKIAQWEPEDFRTMIVEFVEETGFDGIATLPAEARFTIETAKQLPKIVEFS
jgi:hypothetical protein